MKEHLADKHCVPCRGGVPPLEGEELQALVTEARAVADEKDAA